MSALTWLTLRDTLAAALVQAPPPYTVLPADFLTLYTQAISYAEGRIYKDLVLLATRTRNTTLSTVAGSRTLDLSAMTPLPIIVAEGVSLGNSPYDLASLDVIDMLWPDQSVTLAPALADNIGRFWALQDASTIVVSPTPDAIYVATITGLFQPAPLSAGNPSTYLSTVYPELLTAACMIFLSGALMRLFGAVSDDPKLAVSWEAQYMSLKGLAASEERRRRGLAADVNQPAPSAAPPGAG